MIVYITGFLVSLILVFLLIKFSSKINIVDIPRDRSVHREVVPRTGGIGFIGAFFLINFIFIEVYDVNWLILLSIFIVFILGVVDDYKDVSPKMKFLIISLATLILAFDNNQINSLGNYLGYDISLGILAIPFTLFAVLGFTNALNLIDGVDGLAAGISLVILLAFSYTGYQFKDPFILYLSLVTISVLLAFFIFNWNPAKVFMGDAGSLTLGFIISIISILSMQYIHPVVIIYFLAVPIIDTLVVMIRRILNGGSPFEADKTHIHHVLLDFFGSAKKTTVFLIMTQSIFCFLGYVVARHIELYPMGFFPLAMVASFIILISMAYMLFTTIINNKSN